MRHHGFRTVVADDAGVVDVLNHVENYTCAVLYKMVKKNKKQKVHLKFFILFFSVQHDEKHICKHMHARTQIYIRTARL